MPNIKKAYVGGALTHADCKQRNTYQRIGALCQLIGMDSYVPHMWGTDPEKDPDRTPEEVWKINNRQIASARVCIAYVGEPSLGVGAEIELARINDVDIITWWLKGQRVSRMALGNPGIIAKIEAEDEKDLLEQLEIFLKSKYEK